MQIKYEKNFIAKAKRAIPLLIYQRQSALETVFSFKLIQ